MTITLPALPALSSLAGMTKAQISEEYRHANLRAVRAEESLREVDVVYRAECRAQVRAHFRATQNLWINRAADCIVAYRAAAA